MRNANPVQILTPVHLEVTGATSAETEAGIWAIPPLEGSERERGSPGWFYFVTFCSVKIEQDRCDLKCFKCAPRKFGLSVYLCLLSMQEQLRKEGRRNVYEMQKLQALHQRQTMVKEIRPLVQYFPCCYLYRCRLQKICRIRMNFFLWAPYHPVPA